MCSKSSSFKVESIMVTVPQALQILFVHLIYLLYSAFLWYRLWVIAEESNFNKTGTILAVVLWSGLYVALNVRLIKSGLKEKQPNCMKQRWIHLPTLMFILFNMAPYAFTLSRLYKLHTNQIHIEVIRNITQNSQHDDISSKDFVLLHSVSPLLLVTYTLYPRTYEPFELPDYLGLAMELINIFDIMDMMADLKYIISCGTIWVVIYHTAVGMSVILLSFPVLTSSDDLAWTMVTLEKKSNYQLDDVAEKRKQTFENVKSHANFDVSNDETTEVETGLIEKPGTSSGPLDEVDCSAYIRAPSKQEKFVKFDKKEYFYKIVKVTATMIFNNIMFAIIRLKIMATEQSIELGFTMIVKNFLLTVIHLFYLTRISKIYCVNRKSKDKCFCSNDNTLNKKPKKTNTKTKEYVIPENKHFTQEQFV